MTVKTLTGANPAGYSLKANYSGLDLTSTATVGGHGVYLYQQGSVANLGSISVGDQETGVFLYNGGLVTNGLLFASGHIYGYNGVITGSLAGTQAAGTVVNYSYIGGGLTGVFLAGGGKLTNSGSIKGNFGEGVDCYDSGAIGNTGTIAGKTYGVDLGHGGGVTNGAQDNPVGLIEGSTAVFANGTYVDNFATIKGVVTGVELVNGAGLTNGAAADNTALIEGADGVSTFKNKYASDVVNYGTIVGQGAKTYAAVYLYDGGGVTNADTAARIQGYAGVSMANTGNVLNYGVIAGTGSHYNAFGVVFAKGGELTNGSTSDEGALVTGYGGVWMKAGTGTVTNYGTVLGTNRAEGVYLISGLITNGTVSDTKALLSGGGQGVVIETGGTLNNFGTVTSTDPGPGSGGIGVLLGAGGVVTNGGAADTTALIHGYYDAITADGSATVKNFATITAVGEGDSVASHGVVNLLDGGSLTNGTATDSGALIKGYVAVTAFGVSVTNFATIIGTGASMQGYGMILNDGAHLTNGAATDHVALIEGYGGVGAGVSVNVSNFGSIIGAGSMYLAGVILDDGDVVNGAGADTTALIQGYNGVLVAGGGTVTNFATIAGIGSDGVTFDNGGRLTNGSASDERAMVQGYGGVLLKAGGTVTNFATILSTGRGAYGAELAAGGTLTNGSTSDSAALIEGGVVLKGGAAATNFGTIVGGVELAAGGKLTNGGAGHTGAQVDGALAVSAATGGAATVINFATIQGSGGVALQFNTSADVLVVEAGSTFNGAVLGDGGTLNLGSGAGTLTGMNFGSVTVAGSMAKTGFSSFDSLVIGTAASFTLTDTGSVSAGERLTVSGALTVTGALTTSAAVAGAGTLDLTGAANVNTGTSLTVAKIVETGASAIATIGAADLTYAGVWTQNSGTVSATAGARINFTGEGDSFAGTLSGAGTVAFTGGSDALTGATLSATSLIVSNATVTLSGTIDLTSTLTATMPHLMIAAGGVTLSGGGTVAFTNLASNILVGATAGATLTNDDKIKGAGQIGDGTMTLDNAAGALIEGTGTVALTLNTGSNTIINAGTIQAFAAGGVTIASALDNTGLLVANAGTLTVDGAVTGTGKVNVNGGTADFVGAFGQSVDFTGTTGALELGHSQTFTGQVTGLSKGGTDSLELEDIVFADAPTWSYSGTATFGVLTVKDSANHTAKITLEGNYVGSTFVLSAGPGTGTKLIDPPAGPAAISKFIASAAGFVGSRPAGPMALAAEGWRAPPLPLIHGS